MAQNARDVMTSSPATLDAEAPVVQAAQLMRESDAGAIVILDNGAVSGIVTDRDITIRGVAEQVDLTSTPVRRVMSESVQTVAPDYSVEQVIQTMRTNAIRRVPVVEGGSVVGIVSLGDLAIERDADSALADISAAPGDS